MNTKQHMDEKIVTVSEERLNAHPIETLADLQRLDGTRSLMEVRQNINNSEDGDKEALGRSFNCPNCSVAFDMTERGYDVCARPKQSHSNVENIESAYTNGKLTHMGFLSFDSDKQYQNIWTNAKWNKDTGNIDDKSLHQLWDIQDRYTNNAEKKIIDKVLTDGTSRGIIVVGWMTSLDLKKRTNSYHAFNYQCVDGKVYIVDTQSRKPHFLKGWDATTDHFLEGADPRDIFVMRTDNLTPTEEVCKMVYSNRGKSK